MSTRDKLFTMLDMLSDEELEGLYMFLKNMIPINEELNDEMLEAMHEVEDMRLHPENYKSYDSVEAMMEDILHEEV
ncbi:MAG: hypothetical protein K2I93_08235 [Oscillospiraceae bacterium]|nr:hypothetical protein [Oscillospiraceae bacterium]